MLASNYMLQVLLLQIVIAAIGSRLLVTLTTTKGVARNAGAADTQLGPGGVAARGRPPWR